MALTFNGSDHYLSLASAIVSAQPIVVSAWTRHPASAANHSVCDIGTGGSNNRLTLWAPTANEARNWTVRQFSSATMIGSASEIGDDVWHHILAWSNSATDHGTYLDGGLLITDATSETPVPTATEIGGSTGGGSLFDGELAEIAFWSLDISGNELAMATALAKGYSPLFFPNGLVSYLPMIRDTRDLMGTVWTVNGTGNPAAFPHPNIIYPSAQILQFPVAAAGGVVQRMIGAGGGLVGKGGLATTRGGMVG